MKSSLLVVGFLIFLLLSACASDVVVKPVDSTLSIKHVCIQENPNSKVSDFVQVLRDGFDRHGISTEVYLTTKPSNCEYIVTYVANKRWELTYGVFLSDAQIRIEKDGRYIASASFHAGGGFVSSKGQDNKTKMDPIIDELLQK